MSTNAVLPYPHKICGNVLNQILSFCQQFPEFSNSYVPKTTKISFHSNIKENSSFQRGQSSPALLHALGDWSLGLKQQCVFPRIFCSISKVIPRMFTMFDFAEAIGIKPRESRESINENYSTII